MLKNFEILSLNGRNILIKLDENETKTESGIHLLEKTQKAIIDYSTAEIVDVGNEVPEGKYKVGDKIMLSKYRAEDRPYKINGEKLFIVAEGHIIATIK